MPTFSQKSQIQRDKLLFQKEDMVQELLLNFLKSRGNKASQDYEIRLCLEDQGVRFDLAEEDVCENLRDQLPEDASPEEKEEGRLELWSQVLYHNALGELKDHWYEKAKAGEELESLV